MVNLKNFKNKINQTILQRGYEYFLEGYVVEMESRNEGEYMFQVEGTELYEVLIKINRDLEIFYSDCDCPYDFDDVCKHQVAAYYVLEEGLENKGSVVASAQPSLRNVLNSLGKEELINIIEELASKEEALEESLIFRYLKLDEDPDLETYEKLIQSIVKKFKRREGFIHYREVYLFATELQELLGRVSSTNNALMAIDVAFLIMDEGMRAFQYADDSDGEIGYLVNRTIEVIEETIMERDDLDDKMQHEIFHKLMKQSESELFDGWDDFRIEILALCAEAADEKSQRNELQTKIEQLLVDTDSDNYNRYSNESMLKILLLMINRHGTEEEALAFLQENLNYPSFRKMLIERYQHEKEYEKVIELALDGKKRDKGLPGLEMEWMKALYDAYQQLSLTDKQVPLARELLIRGNYEYYGKLKELIGDQPGFYEELKQELKKKSSHTTFLRLIEEENDMEELMHFVKKNPYYLEQYAPMLLDDYLDEVTQSYQIFIRKVSGDSSNRKQYKEVCKVLKNFKKIAGKDIQRKMIEELKDKYIRRPAFLDELGKLK
ncbi:hypothetical protein LC085_01140 [Bacillus tianshenii]|uniref:SWIM zinc finger family protein n=1 Tax=Sutcliffiella tianshenii TaxID=1463404 RepID=UPI001CD44148|nr:hypothetical protein [Bacillus tianshenii]MCA1318497.1 hypothetical protein [Bacillus tianshenii]